MSAVMQALYVLLHDPVFAILVCSALIVMVWSWGVVSRWRLPILLPATLCTAIGLFCYWALGQFGLLFSLLIPALAWGGDAGAAVADRWIAWPRIAPSWLPGKSWPGVGLGIATAIAAGSWATGMTSSSDTWFMAAAATAARIAALALSSIRARLQEPSPNPHPVQWRVLAHGNSLVGAAVATAVQMLLL